MMASIDYRGADTLALDPARFPGLPAGAQIELSRSAHSGGFVAKITGTKIVMELGAWDKHQAIVELVDKVYALVASLAKNPLRPGRHDRGWPKVAQEAVR